MNYEDRIYGKVQITEPVILDLINCPTMQRLKGIDQAGYFEPYYPGTGHSRFEHSIGVYLLLKNYNTSLEEQISGLIHDVSHSAFSHCIDYVLDVGSEKKHNHQDNVFEEFVRKSEIPEIIKKYDLDLNYILDDKNFPLKETELPDLCADRIDYSLRAAVIFNEIENANYFLNNLIVENNKWIFKNIESAEKFSNLFLKLNASYYAGLPSAVMFKSVGDYLRYSLSKNYITEKDLYLTDKVVLEKINHYLEKDKELKNLFDRMNNRVKFEDNPKDYIGEVFCKSRVVDPLCFHEGNIKRVSEIKPDLKEILNKESQPKHYFIKFER